MTRISLGLAVIALLACQSASASFCDAYYPFDGTLTDATGNGYDGMMISQSGPAKPEFGEGKFGQALHITGGAAMRAFVDLHHEVCPKFTITAWFKLPSVGADGPQPIFTTGAVGSSPAIVASGSTLRLYGKGNGLSQKDAIRDGNTWFFVAATFDYEARSYKLYWRNRSLDGTLSESPYNAEDAIWIGTRNDDLKRMAQDLYVDDVHIYGRVLELDEIRDASRNAMAQATSSTRRASTQAVQPNLDGPVDTNTAGTNLTAPDAGLPGPIQQPVATAEDYAAANDEPQTLEDMRAAVAARDPMAESRDAIAERTNENRPLDLSPDGAAASGSGADPDEPKTTIPHPVGNKQYSAVSGTRGDILRELELFKPEMTTQGTFNAAWLTDVQIAETSDRPCRVHLLGLRPIDYGNARVHEQWEEAAVLLGCSRADYRVGATLDKPIWVKLQQGSPKPEAGGDATAIGQIQICHNDRPNQRVKGLRINGARINADGSQTVEGNADVSELANCRRWASAVICPENTQGTGVVIHATEASGSNEQIVGLQLICREVSISLR